MDLFKIILLCFCFVLSLGNYGQCTQTSEKQTTVERQQQQNGRSMKKDTPSSLTDSTIYKIKRLSMMKWDEKDTMAREQKPQWQLKEQPQRQRVVENENEKKEHAQEEHRHAEKAASGADAESTVTTKTPPKTKKYRKNPHGLNKKLLTKLGFTKVRAPNSHNRKRLAIESRRHVSPDDSHMFIVKLPPNYYYYAGPKATNGDGNDGGVTNDPNQHQHHNHQEPNSEPNALQRTEEKKQNAKAEEETNANGKKVSSFPFNSNGRPARIYHWNLPVIKRLLEDKQRFPNVNDAKRDHLIDIKDIPTWSKPWENETVEKSYGKSSSSSMMSSYKKSLKRKSPTYYAPANAVNKNSFNKYFPGNGKPKGFYVIKENQKKPSYYKNIVS